MWCPQLATHVYFITTILLDNTVYTGCPHSLIFPFRPLHDNCFLQDHFFVNQIQWHLPGLIFFFSPLVPFLLLFSPHFSILPPFLASVTPVPLPLWLPVLGSPPLLITVDVPQDSVPWLLITKQVSPGDRMADAGVSYYSCRWPAHIRPLHGRCVYLVPCGSHRSLRVRYMRLNPFIHSVLPTLLVFPVSVNSTSIPPTQILCLIPDSFVATPLIPSY